MKKILLVLVVCLSVAYNAKADNVKPIVKAKIINWVNSYLTYPESAIKNHEEGIVYISFTVNKNGDLTNLKVEKGVSEDLNNEALKVLAKMELKEAYNDAEPNKRYILPIKFELK